jgi:hypothetical protein
MKKYYRHKKITKKRNLQHYAHKPLFSKNVEFLFRNFFGGHFFGHLFLSIFRSTKKVSKSRFLQLLGGFKSFWTIYYIRTKPA